jgi:hypothetical protein
LHDHSLRVPGAQRLRRSRPRTQHLVLPHISLPSLPGCYE